MGFRDDRLALHSKAEGLERELKDARERIAELETEGDERERLEERIAELERSVGLGARRRRPDILRGLAIVGVIGGVALGTVYSRGSFNELVFETPGELPTHGVLDLVEDVTPATVEARTRGVIPAEQILRGCPGYIPAEPVVLLRTAANTPIPDIRTRSNADLILLVQSESGAVYCDDDSGLNLNPMLRPVLTSGMHRVFVGTYSRDQAADFSLLVNATGRPGPEVWFEPTDGEEEQPLPHGRLDAPENDHSVRVGGRAHGVIAARSIEAGCPGFVPIGEQFTVDVESPRTLQFGARGASDLVMLVQTPSGERLCDDDSGGELDPYIEATVSRGVVGVWIGTYTEGDDAEFELTIDAYGPHARLRRTGLQPARRPMRARWSLDEEESRTLIGVAMGDIRIDDVYPGCTGEFSNHPLFAFNTSAARDVTMSVQPVGATLSHRNIRLAIVHPDGSLECPLPDELSMQRWDAGEHLVFAGVQRGNVPVPFNLEIQSEFSASVSSQRF